MLVHAYMQVLVIIHIGLEWISFKYEHLCFGSKVMFPYWCYHAPE